MTVGIRFADNLKKLGCGHILYDALTGAVKDFWQCTSVAFRHLLDVEKRKPECLIASEIVQHFDNVSDLHIELCDFVTKKQIKSFILNERQVVHVLVCQKKRHVLVFHLEQMRRRRIEGCQNHTP